MRKINKLLIANRGEIAVRVIRAAREMGIRTVAVYSDADEHAMHAALADDAISIGEAEPSKSYLDAAKIISKANELNADAIHPGYGFLSERAEFSEMCQRAGIIFIGPSASAMRALGAKIDAKRLAVQNEVPITPGYFVPDAGPDELEAAAKKIGYPVMLKASAGGGGRGMRIVREPKDLKQELSIASDEALKAFGDGAMMVEKLIERPRHIEVQVLADQHGSVATLFERECSIQRRHQKLIEESPSPLFAKSSPLWPQMRSAAERLIRAAGYTNAGTVEFMVDESANAFYFLEVNARLQVEHPVTEAITGIDLVQWQIRVAQGEKLDIEPLLMQGERKEIHGHAIEARIVAEDPARNFLPSVGKLAAWAEPKMPGVRVDTGFGPGLEVSRYYDSLLAKVIAHADSRPLALARLRSALQEFHVIGVKTNIPYLLDIIGHPDFQAGRMDTGFLARELPDWSPSNGHVPVEIGAILAHASGGSSISTPEAPEEIGVWALADSFRNAR